MVTILSLLKIFAAVGARQGPRHAGDAVNWVIDPLSHPVFDTMSERELGDMPFRLTARRTAYETGAIGCG
ncbi:hypothetical protein NKH47_07350 [Mesorhizobium sp. M1060]|uniref:hypothetical protein n=1 Tax=unclassified Mesorhizobium TaxID=325217 RepID=UPI0003CF28D9|nr:MULTISPECIES: hypothetical protein [unclassified Mesorhizobium]ESX96315.1 hypothetical protein X754_01680 [Mesorhizobium sp. LNJC403B00]ESY45760.1 hypothetical protein X746_20080 [Mesorhizobium sp. LNJC380A00]ESZ67186.1 hypothetical protein X728_02280 [Mesorhizobium sp. L103C120A0]WJI44162.1 hypothetical protein NL532_26645 [Mesorhizobium sp. C120A]